MEGMIIFMLKEINFLFTGFFLPLKENPVKKIIKDITRNKKRLYLSQKCIDSKKRLFKKVQVMSFMKIK